ncbi:uncharacterized protein KGF55_003953 [Candida pseudojiufengensis]|uniref:uncharacterized protein n=1 Tax=Candida pseudojiufengensis TaxID=497109 RepID=UPI00222476F5|nr:uncharacterized protein KGF55_003953 [Candida pseudojiufengensis]KAI5961636.1 hypothetical protein KGF55_003953 [Candida pseudojiufengensis]
MRISTLIGLYIINLCYGENFITQIKEEPNTYLVKANIAETLGQKYNPNLDFTTIWKNLSPKNIKRLENLKFNQNDSIDELNDKLLTLIYAGNFKKLEQDEIEDTLFFIYNELGWEI